MRIIAAPDAPGASDEPDGKRLPKAIGLTRLPGAAWTMLGAAEGFHDAEAMEIGGAREASANWPGPRSASGRPRARRPSRARRPR